MASRFTSAKGQDMGSNRQSMAARSMILGASDMEGPFADDDRLAADRRGGERDPLDCEPELDEGGTAHLDALLDLEPMLSGGDVVETHQRTRERCHGATRRRVFVNAAARREHPS